MSRSACLGLGLWNFELCSAAPGHSPRAFAATSGDWKKAVKTTHFRRINTCSTWARCNLFEWIIMWYDRDMFFDGVWKLRSSDSLAKPLQPSKGFAGHSLPSLEEADFEKDRALWGVRGPMKSTPRWVKRKKNIEIRQTFSGCANFLSNQQRENLIVDRRMMTSTTTLTLSPDVPTSEQTTTTFPTQIFTRPEMQLSGG